MAGAVVPTTPSPRIAEKRRRRRAEILHAALRAFRAKGYHTATLEDIADDLGLRKTALYHYFPDKEAILYACHEESLAELARITGEARARFATAAGRLHHLVREHVRVMTETLEGSPLAFEVTALSPQRQAEVIAARDDYERTLREIIERGIADGEFRSLDPKTVSFAILGAINWIARWYRSDGTLDSNQIGDAFADYLLGGLQCP